MERQWLREQLGGRLASQDRLLAEKSAVTYQALGRRETGAPDSAVPSSSAWKTLKASVLKASARTSKRALRRKLKRSPIGRASLSRSLLLALLGRSAGPSSRSKPASGPKLACRRPVTVKRCTRCGKILQRRRTKPVPAQEPASNDPPRRESVVEVHRTNADQLPSDILLMPTSTSNSALDAGPINTTPSSSRRPHPYAMLGSLRSTHTYTHVCRRKSKSSSEWNRIKFMVRGGRSLRRPVSLVVADVVVADVVVAGTCSCRSSTRHRWARGRSRSDGPSSKSDSDQPMVSISMPSTDRRSSWSSTSNARDATT